MSLSIWPYACFRTGCRWDERSNRVANSFPDNPARLGEKFGRLEKNSVPLPKQTFFSLVFSNGPIFSNHFSVKKENKTISKFGFLLGKSSPNLAVDFTWRSPFYSAPFKFFGRTFGQLATLWSKSPPLPPFFSADSQTHISWRRNRLLSCSAVSLMEQGIFDALILH